MMKDLIVYVINIDSNFERRESLKVEADKANLDLCRVSAVLASEVLDDNTHYVSSGVRAAWLSHLKALQLFLETDAEFALIAEDDFQVTDPTKLQKLLRESSTYEFDMIQLGFLITGFDSLLNILISDIYFLLFRILGWFSEIKLFQSLNLSSRMRVFDAINTPSGLLAFRCEAGAHFYLVSRLFAAEVMKLNNPQFLSIDDFYMALARMRAFRMARVTRSLVKQKDFAPWDGARFKSMT